MFGQIDVPVKGGNEIQQETLQNDTGALGSRGEGAAGREGYSRRNGSVATLGKGKWESIKLLLQPGVSNAARRVSCLPRETGKSLLGDQSHKIRKTSAHASTAPQHA